MTPNADEYGPDRKVLQDIVYLALKDSDRWRDVQATCMRGFLFLPVTYLSTRRRARTLAF